MAGLIGLTSADIEIQDMLRAARWEYEGTWIPHPVVRLTTTLPIAVNKPEGRTIVRARWGFDVGAGRPIGNARDDRLTESGLWSSMLGKSHGLVCSTGIYEKAEVDGVMTPLWFRRVDGKPIVMPALVGERKSKEGEKRLCCAIVTTQPNDFFGQFHDRQVCALDAKAADAWMAAGSQEEAMRLLHAPRNEDWEVAPVDNRIFQHGRVELEHLKEVGAVIRWSGKAVPRKPKEAGPQAAGATAPKGKARQAKLGG
jgi:putative SOS response-associated peptidase YedK